MAVDIKRSIKMFQAMHDKDNNACAKAMGVTYVYFSTIKSGKVKPNIKHLIALCKGVMPVSEFIALGE